MRPFQHVKGVGIGAMIPAGRGLPQLPFCWEAVQASPLVLLGLPSLWVTPSKAGLVGP